MERQTSSIDRSLKEAESGQQAGSRLAFRHWNIGSKLNVGFGVLVLLISFVVAVTFWMSRTALSILDSTHTQRVPAALAAAQAQASLLRMQSAVRGYLVLGDLQNIDEYRRARDDMKTTLMELQRLARLRGPGTPRRQQLDQLVVAFQEWAPVAERLFNLHDNPLENQPALRVLYEEIRPLRSSFLQSLDELERQFPEADDTAIPERLSTDLLEFRTSFLSMMTNLDAYVSTGSPLFKYRYGESLILNSAIYARLDEQRGTLTAMQQARWAAVARLRRQILVQIPQIFAIVEGPHHREDLYLFRSVFRPQAEEILQMLDRLVAEEQVWLRQDLEDGRRNLLHMQIAMGLGGILALLVGALMAIRIREAIAGPIRRLAQVARRIGEGDLEAQAQVEANDEIGRLAATFNQMTQRLRETIWAAESANRAKSDFLARMSHELRTPLNGILGYAQILRRDPKLTKAQRQSVQVIEESGHYLLTLIEDILDFARIEAHRLELFPAYVDLASFLESVVAIFRIQAQSTPQLRFVFQHHGPLPARIWVDEKRLRQILNNLLDNAFKFTENGQVSLEVQSREVTSHTATLRFVVSDTGIGMTPEQLSRIFLPFEQVSHVRLRQQGTGLGLAITQSLVEAMGGTLTVESRPGKGTTFRLDLTFRAIWSPDTSPGQERVPAAGLPTGYQGPRRSLLIVDDEPHNRTLLVDLLRPLGFEIREASDGETALECARTSGPDLVLLDLLLPDMDGHVVAQGLRALEPQMGQRPWIVMVSANVAELRRYSDGHPPPWDAFLPKPIDAQALLDGLATWLQLTWDYAPTRISSQHAPLRPPSLPMEEIAPPPPQEVTYLYDLAMKGAIPELRRWAYRQVEDGVPHVVFARHLLAMAESYDEHGIRDFLQGYLLW